MAEAYISIGSNLGDRTAYVARAIDLIRDRMGCRVRVSAPVVTEPWGYESSNKFLNIGVAADCPASVTPPELLAILQGIEHDIDPSSHRNPDGSYRDRRIDIDLIALGGMVVDSPELTLPHPRMEKRDFVLIPMEELMPQWRHPVSGLTPGEMLGQIGDTGNRPSPDTAPEERIPHTTSQLNAISL